MLKPLAIHLRPALAAVCVASLVGCGGSDPDAGPVPLRGAEPSFALDPDGDGRVFTAEVPSISALDDENLSYFDCTHSVYRCFPRIDAMAGEGLGPWADDLGNVTYEGEFGMRVHLLREDDKTSLMSDYSGNAAANVNFETETYTLTLMDIIDGTYFYTRGNYPREERPSVARFPWDVVEYRDMPLSLIRGEYRNISDGVVEVKGEPFELGPLDRRLAENERIIAGRYEHLINGATADPSFEVYELREVDGNAGFRQYQRIPFLEEDWAASGGSLFVDGEEITSLDLRSANIFVGNDGSTMIGAISVSTPNSGPGILGYLGDADVKFVVDRQE